jgi:hypothetical protein
MRRKDAAKVGRIPAKAEKVVHLQRHQRAVSTADDCRRSPTAMIQAGALLLIAALRRW